MHLCTIIFENSLVLFHAPMQLVVPSVVITDVTKLARICKNVIQPFFFIMLSDLKVKLKG